MFEANKIGSHVSFILLHKSHKSSVNNLKVKKFLSVSLDVFKISWEFNKRCKITQWAQCLFCLPHWLASKQNQITSAKCQPVQLANEFKNSEYDRCSATDKEYQSHGAIVNIQETFTPHFLKCYEKRIIGNTIFFKAIYWLLFWHCAVICSNTHKHQCSGDWKGAQVFQSHIF